MQIASCPDRLPARFDFAPIDTCEEAMFAPGADMLVRALVGDEADVRVTFTALGHQLDYTALGSSVRGTLDGRPFELERSASGVSGETPAGPISVRITPGPAPGGVHVEGQAGAMGFRHDLETRADGRKVIRGKFD